MRHPTACVPCVNGHRKCEPAKPICGRCERLGIKCFYNRKMTKQSRNNLLTVEKAALSIRNEYNISTKMAYSICKKIININYLFVVYLFHLNNFTFRCVRKLVWTTSFTWNLKSRLQDRM